MNSRSALFRAALLLFLAAPAMGTAETLQIALEGKHLASVEASGNGHDQLSLTLRNPSASSIAITIPAGLIVQGQIKPDQFIVLRKAETTVPAKSAVDVTLPVAVLSLKCSGVSQPFILTPTQEPRLTPLLEYLATQPDAPRPTTQLAVFCVLENISYGQWVQHLSRGSDTTSPPTAHPTPAEITQAVDVLGLLRQIVPQQTFALAADSELKLRALRNPWCRVKAMQVYGLDLGDGAVPPDLGQLLHTRPGDNCPICRQRALLQQSQSDL